MKRFFLLAFFALLLVGTASAQEARPERRADQRADRRLHRLDERLDLTEAQEARLKELRTRQRAEAKAWADANPNATREERRAHREMQARAAHEAFLSVLTPEQTRQVEQFRETAREQRGKRGQQRLRRTRTNRADFGAALNLTDTQKEQLQALHQEQRQAAQRWREANPDASREDRRAFTESRHAQRQAALERILTQEQRQQLDERKAQARQQRVRKHRGDR